jgi:plasmid stabilization system protein ParE
VRIIIKKRAQNTLDKVADWIEENYFVDSSIKWLDEFEEAIRKIAQTGVKHAICNHASLARYQYRCFTYKSKWVVAYKTTPTKVIVHRFIFGARLK